LRAGGTACLHASGMTCRPVMLNACLRYDAPRGPSGAERYVPLKKGKHTPTAVMPAQAGTTSRLRRVAGRIVMRRARRLPQGVLGPRLRGMTLSVGARGAPPTRRTLSVGWSAGAPLRGRAGAGAELLLERLRHDLADRSVMLKACLRMTPPNSLRPLET